MHSIFYVLGPLLVMGLTPKLFELLWPIKDEDDEKEDKRAAKASALVDSLQPSPAVAMELPFEPLMAIPIVGTSLIQRDNPEPAPTQFNPPSKAPVEPEPEIDNEMPHDFDLSEFRM
jgi:hypothetical protein